VAYHRARVVARLVGSRQSAGAAADAAAHADAVVIGEAEPVWRAVPHHKHPAVSRNSSVRQSAPKALSRALDIRVSGPRSSSVNRIRPETFSLRIRFPGHRYSFSSVSGRHSNRATVAINRQPNPIQFSLDGLLYPLWLSAQGYARRERIPRERLHEHHGSQTSFWTARADCHHLRASWRMDSVVSIGFVCQETTNR